MATKREKKDDDRLSQLFDDLIQKIMSLLSPLESAKLSNLSKRLSSVWLSSPEPHRLCLGYGLIIRRNLETLTITDNLGQCSNRINRPFPVSVFSSRWITSLSLQYLKFSDGELLVVDSPLLNKFRLKSCSGLAGVRLSGAVKRVSVHDCIGLGRLHLDGNADLQVLSYSSYHSNDRCKIDFNAASHKSLRTLKMRYSAIVTDNWLRDKVSKLVSLETLTLEDCRRLASVQLDDQNSQRLKNLTISWGYNIPSVNLAVSVSGLESLTLEGHKQHHNIDFHKCISLKRLKMVHSEIIPRMIEANLTSNQFLEDVTLKDCFFSLDSDSVPKSSESVVMCHNLAVNYLRVSKDADEYIRTRDFLCLFSHCNTVRLNVQNEMTYMYPKKMREILKPPLYEVKNLTVKVDCPSYYQKRCMTEFVDSFLWLAPRLHTLSLHFSDYGVMIKFNYATQQGVPDRTACCSNALMTCWRHGVTEVLIAVSNIKNIDEKVYNYFAKNVNTKITMVDQHYNYL